MTTEQKPHQELISELREIVKWRYIRKDRERRAVEILDRLAELFAERERGEA